MTSQVLGLGLGLVGHVLDSISRVPPNIRRLPYSLPVRPAACYAPAPNRRGIKR